MVHKESFFFLLNLENDNHLYVFCFVFYFCYYLSPFIWTSALSLLKKEAKGFVLFLFTCAFIRDYQSFLCYSLSWSIECEKVIWRRTAFCVRIYI